MKQNGAHQQHRLQMLAVLPVFSLAVPRWHCVHLQDFFFVKCIIIIDSLQVVLGLSGEG